MGETIPIVDGKRFADLAQARAYATRLGKKVQNQTREEYLAQGVNPDELPMVEELHG